MLREKLEGAFAVDRVASIEVFHLCSIRKTKLHVQPEHLGVFIGNQTVLADLIVMPAFYHEGARENQIGHLSVVKGVPHVKIGHFPLDGVHEAEPLIRRGNFRSPMIEIARTY